MKKKNYTAPALSVEEFELNEVICTSLTIESNGIFEPEVKGGTVTPRAKNRRGIWDED